MQVNISYRGRQGSLDLLTALVTHEGQQTNCTEWCGAGGLIKDRVLVVPAEV